MIEFPEAFQHVARDPSSLQPYTSMSCSRLTVVRTTAVSLYQSA